MSGLTRIAYICAMSVSCVVLLVSCEAVTAQQITYPLVHDGPGTGFSGGGRAGRDAGGGQQWRGPGSSDGPGMNHSPGQSRSPDMNNPFPMNSPLIEEELPEVPGLPDPIDSRHINKGENMKSGSSSRNSTDRSERSGVSGNSGAEASRP
ncbi:hypothetical protein D3C74_82480 [compost metagenome]